MGRQHYHKWTERKNGRVKVGLYSLLHETIPTWRVLSSNNGVAEDAGLLGCDARPLGSWLSAFWRTVVSSSSRDKESSSRIAAQLTA